MRRLSGPPRSSSTIDARSRPRFVDGPLSLLAADRAPRETHAWVIRATWAFVGLGFALRILQYAANRSLAIDESYLALNLIEKSPRQLLHSLDFSQAAPLAFLQVEKFVVAVVGRDEYALRLLPLLASLLSLIVFCRVAQRLLQPVAAGLAVAVFALLDPLIYYAATAKQYGFDVAGAVLILAAALTFERRPLRGIELLLLAVFGAVLVWFSHAAAFGLAALGLLFAVRLVKSRDWRSAPSLLAVTSLWAGSFTIQYVLSQSNLTRIIGAFEQGGGNAFQPTGSGPNWFVDTLDRLRYVVGLEDAASGRPSLASLPPDVSRSLTLLIVLIGAVGFLSLIRRRPQMALVLGLPPALAVVASTLHEYPLANRTVLFALPAVTLCVAEGMYVFITARAPRAFSAFASVVAISVVAAIAALPTAHAVHPRTNEEMKQALSYIGARHRRGDSLYVSSGAQYAFAYYHLCGCSAFDPEVAWPFSTVSGPRGSSAAVKSRSRDLIIESGRGVADLKPLLGRRHVWVLFAELGGDPRNEVLDYLGDHGRLLQRFRTSGPSAITASVYLYDLKRRSRR